MWKTLFAPLRIFTVIGTAADAAEYGLNSLVKDYRRANEVSEKNTFGIHTGNLERALADAAKEVAKADIKLAQEIEALSQVERDHYVAVKAKLEAAWKAHTSRQPATVEE
jgi:hypothetical protein